MLNIFWHRYTYLYMLDKVQSPGLSCSKLTTSLVNLSLNFQTLICNICQYFLLKKCEKLASLIFQQKISVYLIIKS